MKKSIVLVCCVFLLWALVSCDEIAQSSNGSFPETNESHLTKQTNYTIYTYISAGNDYIDDKPVDGVVFESAEKKNFNLASKTEIGKPIGTAEKYEFELNGKLYSFDYDKSYETAIAASDGLKTYSLFNRYKNDDTRIDIRTDTNDVLFFANSNNDVETAKGNLNEVEAKVVADSTLLSLYGESAVQEYAYETAVFTDTKLETHYTVVYRKFVWDIPTNDAIQITVNMHGDVIGIHAKNLGIFSSAEMQVSSEELQNAISVIKEKYSEKWIIGAMQLVLDSEGDYYIYAQLSRTVAEETEAVEVYVNVQ